MNINTFFEHHEEIHSIVIRNGRVKVGYIEGGQREPSPSLLREILDIIDGFTDSFPLSKFSVVIVRENYDTTVFEKPSLFGHGDSST